jgi:Ca2+-binding RTX toxin-like protein
VDGGANTDTIVLTATSADLTAAIDGDISNVEAVSASTAGAGVAIDLSTQTEGFTITGSGFADTITGTAAADTINAGAGADTINGFAGADIVDGGNNTDTIALTATSADLNAAIDGKISNVEAVSAAGAGAPVTIDLHNQTEAFTITGSGFADTITAAAGGGTMSGGAGTDTLTGGVGNDTLFGGSDNDILEGGGGTDTINGGIGTDTASYDNASSGVTVDLSIAIQQNTVGAGLDTLTLIENLTGSAFADNLHGNSSNNTLEGGAGGDLFVFNNGDGDDTISDFVAGVTTDDVIDLRAWGFSSVGEVLALATDDGTDTTIDFTTGDTLVLQHVLVTDLHANDFLLA